MLDLTEILILPFSGPCFLPKCSTVLALNIINIYAWCDITNGAIALSLHGGTTSLQPWDAGSFIQKQFPSVRRCKSFKHWLCLQDITRALKSHKSRVHYTAWVTSIMGMRKCPVYQHHLAWLCEWHFSALINILITRWLKESLSSREGAGAKKKVVFECIIRSLSVLLVTMSQTILKPESLPLHKIVKKSFWNWNRIVSFVVCFYKS